MYGQQNLKYIKIVLFSCTKITDGQTWPSCDTLIGCDVGKQEHYVTVLSWEGHSWFPPQHLLPNTLKFSWNNPIYFELRVGSDRLKFVRLWCRRQQFEEPRQEWEIFPSTHRSFVSQVLPVNYRVGESLPGIKWLERGPETLRLIHCNAVGSNAQKFIDISPLKMT